METCKTCRHWTVPNNKEPFDGESLCRPIAQDTLEPMDIGFEIRLCKNPCQTFSESPTEINGFGLTDASMYYAVLATAEEFGCVRHESNE